MEAVNPYFRRSAISSREEFFGRRSEIKEIYELIEQHQSIFLIGERRTGKSSILNAINFLRGDYNVSPEKYFMFVNCLYAEKSPERRFVKHMLNQIVDELDLDPLPPERDSLRAAARQARERGRKIVILMDEIDVLLANPEIGEDLYSFFRAWSDEFRITFVISTREGRIEPLLEKESVGSPFWNIFKVIYVGPLTHGESLELITTPAERCGAPFAPGEVEWIHERGGHHPFFLQIAASYAFTKRGLDGERKHAAFMEEADQHLEYLLDFMPPKQLAALEGFLRGQPLDPRVESKLLLKGTLIDEDGRRRIFSSAFKDKLEARFQQPNRAAAEGLVGNLNRLFRGEMP